MGKQLIQRDRFERTQSFREILKEACSYLGVPLPDLPLEAPEEALQVARGFVNVIGIERAPALARDKQALKERLSAFISQRRRDDSQVEQNAAQLFIQVAGLTRDDANRLIDKLTVKRLRIYTDKELRSIAEQFFKWDPLVCFIQEPVYREGKEEFNEVLGALMKRLERRIAQYDRAVLGGYDSEDAISEAFLLALQAVSDPSRGYRYEGDFFGWLTSTALNRLRTERRNTNKTESEQVWGDEYAGESVKSIFDSIASPSSPFSELAYEEFFKQYQERYLLAESFSKSENNERRVKLIWSAMLLQEEITVARLAEVIEEKLGEPLNINTLTTTIGRLRQRLDVLNFVLDLVPAGFADEPGDASLISWLQKKWARGKEEKSGALKEKESTLRHLAALARASRRSKTLAWSILARHLVDKFKEEAEILDVVRPLLRASGCKDSEANTKLADALKWLDAPYKAILKELRKQATANDVGFFLSPCWNLAVPQGLGQDDAVRILNPAPEDKAPFEAGYIRTAMSKLR